MTQYTMGDTSVFDLVQLYYDVGEATMMYCFGSYAESTVWFSLCWSSAYACLEDLMPESTVLLIM